MSYGDFPKGQARVMGIARDVSERRFLLAFVNTLLNLFLEWSISIDFEGKEGKAPHPTDVLAK